jgi:uncharacterized phage infection (PIP) family protein YhgE
MNDNNEPVKRPLMPQKSGAMGLEELLERLPEDVREGIKKTIAAWAEAMGNEVKK